MTVIDGAIDYLHEHHWTRGKNEDSIGRVCMMGALLKSRALRLKAAQIARGNWIAITEMQHIDREYYAALAAIVRVVRQRVPCAGITRPDSGHIEEWNDHHAKDVDEVIEVLKLANEELEKSLQ